MNYALGKPRGGACFKVQVEGVNGTVTEYTGKDELENAIWDNIHRKRFILAEDTPLCSGKLRGEFGYNTISLAASSILAGTYEYLDDSDEATKEILHSGGPRRERPPQYLAAISDITKRACGPPTSPTYRHCTQR
jgi:hypothetical protein